MITSLLYLFILIVFLIVALILSLKMINFDFSDIEFEWNEEDMEYLDNTSPCPRPYNKD